MKGLPSVTGLDELGILFALLPGLLTYLVKHTLVARHESLSATKVVLWGLAYTLIDWAVWEGLKWPGSLLPTPDLVGLSVTAVAVGTATAAADSSGLLFKFARRLRLTNQPVFPSVWRAAFHQFRFERKGEWVVLHLRDGRRMMGGVAAISPTRKDGHVLLQPATWLPEEPDDGAGDAANPAAPMNPGGYLLSTADVAIVEYLLPPPPEDRDAAPQSAAGPEPGRDLLPDDRSGGVVRSGDERPAAAAAAAAEAPAAIPGPAGPPAADADERAVTKAEGEG